MPTVPSAPVTTVSACLTCMPAVAGSFLPERSMCAAPFTVLIWPMSLASTAAGNASAPMANAMIQRIFASLQETVRSYTGGRQGRVEYVFIATYYDVSRPPRGAARHAQLPGALLRQLLRRQRQLPAAE